MEIEKCMTSIALTVASGCFVGLITFGIFVTCCFGRRTNSFYTSPFATPPASVIHSGKKYQPIQVKRRLSLQTCETYVNSSKNTLTT